MSGQDRSCAVLLFTRTAENEAKAKPLLGNKKGDSLLSKALIDRATKLAKSSGLPLIISDSTTQIGGSFGTRLHNAIQSVWTKGYQKVVVIGNDCPDLSTRHIREAAALLESQELVVGPSHDGGCYLIGLHQQGYNGQEFSRLAWQSSRLMDSLGGYARLNGLSSSQLILLRDIDSLGQLLSHVSLRPLTDSFSQVLASIISAFLWGAQITSLTCLYPLPAQLNTNCLRGPPLRL